MLLKDRIAAALARCAPIAAEVIEGAGNTVTLQDGTTAKAIRGMASAPGGDDTGAFGPAIVTRVSYHFGTDAIGRVDRSHTILEGGRSYTVMETETLGPEDAPIGIVAHCDPLS